MADRELMLEGLSLQREAVSLTCAEIREFRFPSDAPLRLVDIIEHLVEAIESRIAAEARGLGNSEDFDDNIRLARQAIERLAAHLRLAERASSQKVLPGSARAFVQLAEQLLPGSEFIIRPQWDSNYSIQEMLLTYRDMFTDTDTPEAVLVDGAQFERLTDVKPGQQDGGLYVLGFPWIERDRALFHVALGHELGHAIADRFFREKLVRPLLTQAIDEIVADVSKAITAQPQLAGDKLIADRVHDAQVTCSRVLEETMADLTGLHLFGYAALVYTHRMGELHGMDELAPWAFPEQHYPPWRFRLRAMMETVPEGWLDDLLRHAELETAWAEAVRKEWEALLRLVRDTRDLDAAQKVPMLRIAYDAVRRLLPTARDYVADQLRHVGLALTDLPGLVHRDLIDRLCEGYPPDAYATPDSQTHELVDNRAGLRGILTVGWVARLIASIPPPEAEVDTQKVDVPKRLRLEERLVGKALEYSDIREAWSNSAQRPKE